MRKWLILIDATILTMALALLIIDLKIKEDVIRQAKELQEKINGQRSQESASVPGSVSGNILPGDNSDNPSVASENPAEKSTTRGERATGDLPAKRRGGNSSTRIHATSE
jgi:hypothetical protein